MTSSGKTRDESIVDVAQVIRTDLFPIVSKYDGSTGSMHRARILIRDPDPAGLALLRSMLTSLGQEIEEAPNVNVAIRLIEHGGTDLVMAVVEPDDSDALELLTHARCQQPAVPVILLIPRSDPDRATDAVRRGAATVLKYPVSAVMLRAAVAQALEYTGCRRAMEPIDDTSRPTSSTLGFKPAAAPPRDSVGLPAVSVPNPGPRENPGLPLQQGTPTSDRGPTNSPELATIKRVEQAVREIGLIGHDPGWLQVIELARILAAKRTPLLIVGEPGTGKSLVARLIHALGDHSESPFVTADVSAMGDQFAGGNTTEPPCRPPAAAPPEWSSKLDLARGGTLYIDEVCGMSTDLQLHLLRELRSIGFGSSTQAPRSDVRYVMSSCENMTELIERGRLHEELCHRISLLSLMLPPLRHRGMDIELLAESFRARYAREFGRPVRGFARDALNILQRHNWPGNVRELAAAVRRAVALSRGPLISSSQLAPIINHLRLAGDEEGTPRAQMGIRPLAQALDEPEKRIIIQALRAFDWSRQKTAQALDINRTTLYKKMQKYHLKVRSLSYED
jgi:two-component system response regulator HydG